MISGIHKTNEHISALLNLSTDTPIEVVVEQLRCALKITRLGIWSWDLLTQKIFLSPELYAIIGMDPIDFDGSINTIAEKVIHPDFRYLFTSSIENDLNTLNVITRDFRINHPVLAECWVRINGQILYDQNHKPIKLIGTILDITEDYLHKSQLNSELSFFGDLIETLPNPVFYKNNLGIYQFCNKAFLDYLGLERNQVIGHTAYDIAPLELAEIYHKADMDLMVTKGSQVYESQIKYADNTYHDVIFSKAAHPGPHGEILGLAGIIQDISDKRIMEKQLKMLHQIKDVFLEISHTMMTFKSEKQLLEALLEKLRLIFDKCTQCSILEIVNNQYLSIIASNGYDDEEINNFTIPLRESFIWKDLDGHLYQAHIINNIQHYLKDSPTKAVNTTDGRSIASSLAVPVMVDNSLQWIFAFDSDQNFIYSETDRMVADFIREELPIIYRMYDLYRKTLQLSRYDSLTGLVNRSYFEQIYEDLIYVAERHNQGLILALFDLDGLKRINDTLGHLAGDAYIRTFSSFITNNLRRSDVFARIGGDEFIGVFTNITFAEIFGKLHHMRAEFEQTLITSEMHAFRGSFSFGISEFIKDTLDRNKLIQIADMRMYKDKVSRKNDI